MGYTEDTWERRQQAGRCQDMLRLACISPFSVFLLATFLAWGFFSHHAHYPLLILKKWRNSGVKICWGWLVYHRSLFLHAASLAWGFSHIMLHRYQWRNGTHVLRYAKDVTGLWWVNILYFYFNFANIVFANPFPISILLVELFGQYVMMPWWANIIHNCNFLSMFLNKLCQHVIDANTFISFCLYGVVWQ